MVFFFLFYILFFFPQVLSFNLQGPHVAMFVSLMYMLEETWTITFVDSGEASK